jgi:transcriptional regulator with XRE-family HTH domain/mannose-6-phosphate isomerase-like protein (cupin superfamily)
VAERASARSALSVVDDDVPRRLRAARERRGISLRELARRLGISPSAISQIETGRARPSVATLWAIVTELGMSLDDLFAHGADGRRGDAAAGGPAPADPTAERMAAADPTAAGPTAGGTAPADPAADEAPPAPTGPAAASLPVVTEATREALQLATGVRWERMTAGADPDVDFIWVVYDVGGSSSPEDSFIRHAGREYGLVLSGHLEVTVGFEARVLGPGDSISFESTTPHRLRNAGDEPVTGVWVVVGRRSDARADPGAAPPPQPQP